MENIVSIITMWLKDTVSFLYKNMKALSKRVEYALLKKIGYCWGARNVLRIPQDISWVANNLRKQITVSRHSSIKTAFLFWRAKRTCQLLGIPIKISPLWCAGRLLESDQTVMTAGLYRTDKGHQIFLFFNTDSPRLSQQFKRKINTGNIFTYSLLKAFRKEGFDADTLIIYIAHELGHYLTYKQSCKQYQSSWFSRQLYKSYGLLRHSLPQEQRVSPAASTLILLEEFRAWDWAQKILHMWGFTRWDLAYHKTMAALRTYHNSLIKKTKIQSSEIKIEMVPAASKPVST